MEEASLRRSDRVSLTLLLETSGKDATGQEFKEASRTLLINRTGAVIVLERELSRRAAHPPSPAGAHGEASRRARPRRGAVRAAKRRLPLRRGNSSTARPTSGELSFPAIADSDGRRGAHAAGMQLLPQPRSGLPERTRIARLRNQSRHRAALQDVPGAQHLDAGSARRRKENQRRARLAAAAWAMAPEASPKAANSASAPGFA